MLYTDQLVQLMVYRFLRPSEARCVLCDRYDVTVSQELEVCGWCIRDRPDDALPSIRGVHAKARARFGLPESPPRKRGGVPCNLCANECTMGVAESGFCGLRSNLAGRLVAKATSTLGLLSHYRDPHVTNCCSNWFCPAGTGAEYPKYAYRNGAETGYENLAIFLYGCNFNCLFCQNWTHKKIGEARTCTVEELVDTTIHESRISCWCFFGGSPEPQLPFTINASRRILETLKGKRILRICYEWNGCGNRVLVKRVGEIALGSGGNIKFDLKCYDPNLSVALSGVPNERAYENFEMLFHTYYGERSQLPLLTATTLLVPGYVDAEEVDRIASFIAELDPEIPYSLLVFHPDFLMWNLPVTPRRQVRECLEAASRHLHRVNVGNLNLLALTKHQPWLS